MAKKAQRVTRGSDPARSTSRSRARKGSGAGQATPQSVGSASATTDRVQRTGGADRPATMAEEREVRANQASGAGPMLGRSANTRNQPKLTPAQAEAAKKGTPRAEQPMPSMQVQGQLDHAAVNHTREKDGNQGLRSEIGGARTEARGSTPWPQDITKLDDTATAETIRTTDKADVLIKFRKDERLSAQPRQWVIDLIYEKLLRVQGPPLPAEE